MAVGSREETKARRRDSPVSPQASTKLPGSSQHGMSYNPSAPVSGTAVAQPLAQHSLGLDGPDLPQAVSALPTHSPKDLADKRRVHRGKIPPVIKRSSSTPHMRALALGESSPISPNSDKRRNKLGYHRTSVACGHCRRRKIRCLLAPDDPQGRCSNCIRLKKECNFYPVEQQNPGESRSQAAKRGSVSQVPSSSSSSSPRASNTSGHEAIEEYGSFQPMPAGEPPPGFPIAPELDGPVDMKSHPSGVVPQQNSFPYSPNFNVSGWDPNYAGQTPSDGHSDGSSVAYWSTTGAPVSSSFFTDSVGAQGQSNHDSHHGQMPQQFPMHEQPIWPGGLTRSMSYGGPDSMPHDFRFHNANPLAVQQQRHSTHELPSSTGHTTGPPNVQTTVPPGWQPFIPPGSEGMQPGPVQPYNGQWFTEQTPLGSVEEEQNLANQFYPL